MILSKLFGTKSQREIKKLSSEVDKINHSYKLFSENNLYEWFTLSTSVDNFFISRSDFVPNNFDKIIFKAYSLFSLI